MTTTIWPLLLLLTDASNNPINYFIFKQGAAGMKSGIELLNTEAKVSAYTIRVLDGKGVDKKTSRAYMESI